MLKNFFSISKNQVAVLTTLVVLIMLASVYFFIYLPANEKTLQAQRFRALQNIDRNIHAKIENSVALLNNLLTEYQTGNAGKRDTLKKYIEGYSKTNFTLLQADSESYKKGDSAENSLDSGYQITVNNNTKQITLFLVKQNLSDKETSSSRIGMVFSFEQFIKLLLPKNVFDEYIVFSQSKPVYETFPSGISYPGNDSLFIVKKETSTTPVINQNVSGTDYKIFLHPVSLAAGSEWMISGLLTNTRYQHEKNELPTTIILLLVTILLIILVTFPLIKLYQMGSKDRLTKTDGISSIFISMLLMSLLFFVFFKYNLPLRSGKIKDSKAILANSISKAFNNEMESLYKKINVFDSLIKKEYTLQKGIPINADRTSIALLKKSNQNTGTDSLIAATCEGSGIKQAFWLNSAGRELINWTTDKANAPHGYFPYREYFINIINNRPYLLNRNVAKKYYIDQVISWTSGSFTSVVSIPSRLSNDNSHAVAALSVNIQSLDSVILPAGYLFAVVDRLGRVLYHSEKYRNLNENLLEEFSDKTHLQSCLQAKTGDVFSTKYSGKKYTVLVQPLAELPYSMVIFEDTAFKETRDAEIYSFTISMLVLFFAFLVLQLLVVFLVSARQSFFKKQRFDTTWIGPKISCQKEYVLAAVFNIIIIIALFVSFGYCTFLQYFFILLFSCTVMPFFLNGIFAIRYWHEKRNALQYKKTALWSLGILIVLINIAAPLLLSNGHYTFVLWYQISLAALMAILYYFKEKILTAGIRLQSGLRLLQKWDYASSFAFMGLTRLIATSGIPIVFFYCSSYNYEQNLIIRYKHIDFLNKLYNKMPAPSKGNIFTLPPGVYTDSNWITTVSEIDSAAFPSTYSKPYTPEHSSTLDYLKLFHLGITDLAVAEENFYTPGAGDSSFYFNHLLDSACTNQNGTMSCIQTAHTGKYLQAKSGELNYRFPDIFKKDNSKKGMLFWGILLASLVVFYFLICSIIKELFSLYLPNLTGWKDLDNKILTEEKLNQLVFVIGLPGSGKKYHILNKIYNGEIRDEKLGKNFVYDETDKTHNNVFIADLIHIPDSSSDESDQQQWKAYIEKVFDEKNRLIIVNHFEYNIQDPLTNRIKLNFLERLMLDENCKIIILSSIHPVAFLDSAMAQSTKKKENTITNTVPGEDLERWHILLGHYRIVLLPIEPAIPTEELSKHLSVAGGQVLNVEGKALPKATVIVKNTTDSMTETLADGSFTLATHYRLPFKLVIQAVGYITEEVTIKKNNETIVVTLEEAFYNWKDRIRAETHYTHFLHRMQQAAIDVTTPLNHLERMAKSDELAFKLQVTSHYFYMYIWQSLTKEEKFLLYDLAEDNLVNSYDNYNLCMLIGKGIIIPTDGTLKLFNKGFRNFILTAIGNTEAMKIKNEIKDNGNWNKLKNPLLMVILAILAFLLTSQEESYSKVITYLAALGAGIPTVLKIFSVFEKQNDKPG